MNDTRKEAYQEKTEAQIQELEARIDLVRAKANQAKADAKIEYAETLEDLRSKQADARRKLQELHGTGLGAWEDLKQGMDEALNDLENAVDQAVSRFK